MKIAQAEEPTVLESTTAKQPETKLVTTEQMILVE